MVQKAKEGPWRSPLWARKAIRPRFHVASPALCQAPFSDHLSPGKSGRSRKKVKCSLSRADPGFLGFGGG